MIWNLADLIRHAATTRAYAGRAWVPSRPLPAPFVVRLRAAWLVLSGQADAVVWPPQA